MTSKKKLWLAICIGSAAIAVGLAIFFIVTFVNSHSSVDKYIEEAYVPVTQTDIPASEYISPIDFDKLKKINSDIYAWITIPDTKVNYPIAQKYMDDSYYLDHAIDGKKDSRGTLFTESLFNSTEFNDRVTVIYGHDMKNGSMFGRLQSYSNSKYFNSHREFCIYLPEKTLHYKVFAALPFSNKHILYSWNFDKEGQMENFLRNVRTSKSLLANIDKDIEIGVEDNIVILSTCLKSDSSKRFLVMGVLTDVED